VAGKEFSCLLVILFSIDLSQFYLYFFEAVKGGFEQQPV